MSQLSAKSTFKIVPTDMTDPLEHVSNSELHRIVRACRKDQKDAYQIIAMAAEHELMARHMEHPSTIATFLAYQVISW